MRIKTGLILASAAAVVVALAAVFLVMPQLNIKSDKAEEPASTTLGHASKPSPAVPFREKKLAGSASKPAQATSNSDMEKAWPPDGMQVAAHHKGHRGCDGMLTLKASGLQFTCPGDNGKSFFVALNDIRGTDQDGIVMTSGEKYHFDGLPAGGKEYVERLFTDWLAHVRPTQTPAQ